ncbi:MAG: creatininase family protein, partial [Leptolyngbyaceae cyanobacterium]
AIAKELYGYQEGSHATPSEVALPQFAYPNDIKQAALNPAIAHSGYPIYSAADFRAHNPDGRMGSTPALATPARGQRLYDAAVKDLSSDYLQILAAE